MTRLFVYNLPWTVDSDDLMSYLSSENFSVESVQVIKDKTTGQSKGYAFVEFTNGISAKAAFDAFHDGKLHLGGRKLCANEAHPKTERPKSEAQHPTSSFVSPQLPRPNEALHGRRGRRNDHAWDEQD
jgi:RNA recognition motif-containing protein